MIPSDDFSPDTRDPNPIEADCTCETCQTYSRAALRHWFHAGEATAPIAVSAHNIHMFTTLMARARQAIIEDRFSDFHSDFLTRYGVTIS